MHKLYKQHYLLEIMVKNLWTQLGKPNRRMRVHGGVMIKRDKLILDWDEITPSMRKHLLERCCYCGYKLEDGKCPNEFCKSNRMLRK